MGAGRADAARLRELAAAAVGFWVPDSGWIVAPAAGRRVLGDFYLFHCKSLKIREIEGRLLDRWLARRCFIGISAGLVRGHQDIDVFEDTARSDAEDAVEGFDEVVAFAAGMLAAEMVDEGETGSELFGFYEKTRAVRLPFL